MYPGHPTQLSGRLIITDLIDQEVQANIVVNRAGKQAGAYLDDSTPNLGYWLRVARVKYATLRLPLLVAVAPGNRGLHHRPTPPCRNMIEFYPYGNGEPASYAGQMPTGYECVIIQQMYPGPYATTPPGKLRRWWLRERALKAMDGDRDRVWMF